MKRWEAILTRRQESALWTDRPPPRNGYEEVASAEDQGKTTKLIEIDRESQISES